MMIDEGMPKRSYPDAVYQCEQCAFTGNETYFTIKVLSVIYRTNYKQMHEFSSVKCPSCYNLITILFQVFQG